MPKNNTKGGFDKNPQNINRSGRPPKGYSITDAFKEMFTKDPETKARIVNAIRKKAEEGDATAQKLLWNYMDGMPAQSKDDPGSEDNPMHMTVTIKKL